MIQLIFLVLFFIDGVANLVSVVRESKRLEHITKPLLMPLLALYYIFGSINKNFDWLIVVALLCGCAGDVFLMLENEDKWFMFGMVSFLLGHIFYIISFLLSISNADFPLWGIVLFAPVIVILLFIYPKYKNNLGDMKIPVQIYMGAILLMHIFAVLRLTEFNFFSLCFIFVWIGSILFVLSDSLIAVNTFNEEIKISYIRVYIMLTYILGQFLIVQGVLLIGLLK